MTSPVPPSVRAEILLTGVSLFLHIYSMGKYYRYREGIYLTPQSALIPIEDLYWIGKTIWNRFVNDCGGYRDPVETGGRLYRVVRAKQYPDYVDLIVEQVQ